MVRPFDHRVCRVHDEAAQTIIDTAYSTWLTTARLELALQLRISADKTTKIGRPITSVSEPLSSLMSRTRDFKQLPSKLLTRISTKLAALNATMIKATLSGTAQSTRTADAATNQLRRYLDHPRPSLMAHTFLMNFLILQGFFQVLVFYNMSFI